MFPRALLLWLSVTGAFAAEVKVIEQIVAKVNGDIITRGELERGRPALEEELKQQNGPPARMQELLKQKEANALRDQVDALLLVQKAKELNIDVEAQLAKELADLQMQNKITDPDKFHQWVQEQAGMPFEDFRQQMKNRAMEQRVMRQEVGGKITIPTAELVAGAEKRAKDILVRAKKGEKFAELARDTSDAESAKNFDQIGWFKKADLNPKLQRLFREKRGYLTDVMKTENGFVIFKMEERHEEGLASFEEVENEITEKLYAT